MATMKESNEELQREAIAGIDLLMTLAYGRESGSAATALQLVQRIEGTLLSLVMNQMEEIRFLENRINELANRT